MLYFNRAKSGVMFYNSQTGLRQALPQTKPGGNWRKAEEVITTNTSLVWLTTGRMILEQFLWRKLLPHLLSVLRWVSRRPMTDLYTTVCTYCTRLVSWGCQTDWNNSSDMKTPPTFNASQIHSREQKDNGKRAKIPGVFIISTLLPIERRLLKEKLTSKPLPTPYIMTQDQSQEAISSLL